MLEPAILHKDELLKLFSKEIYTKDYFYYTGYPNEFTLPTIEVTDHLFQWAIIDKNKVIGFLSYYIDNYTDCAYRFGLYSFDRGNPIIGLDLFKKMEELVQCYHRIEWRVIEGNPVIKHYDKFCKRYNGYKTTLHHVTKGLDGEWLNSYCYEIIKMV